MSTRPCPCNSGLPSQWQYDARGIELCRTCSKCHDEKMSHYRPDVLTDGNYWACEDIESDPVVQDFANLRTAVYQGVNTLCAHCGDPIPDGDGVQGTPDWKGEVFLFCDAECRGSR